MSTDESQDVTSSSPSNPAMSQAKELVVHGPEASQEMVAKQETKESMVALANLEKPPEPEPKKKKQDAQDDKVKENKGGSTFAKELTENIRCFCENLVDKYNLNENAPGADLTYENAKKAVLAGLKKMAMSKSDSDFQEGMDTFRNGAKDGGLALTDQLNADETKQMGKIAEDLSTVAEKHGVGRDAENEGKMEFEVGPKGTMTAKYTPLVVDDEEEVVDAEKGPVKDDPELKEEGSQLTK